MTSAIPSHPANPALHAEMDFQSCIKETKEIVYRLLKYAVSDADRKVDPQLIAQAVDILQKSDEESTAHDLQELWNLYNELSVLVHPATNESLWLKEHIERDDRAQAEGKSTNYSTTARAYKKTYNSFKWMGYFFGLLFFILQSYSSMLSDTLDQVSVNYAERTRIKEQMLAIKQANPKINNCDLPLKELENQYVNVLLNIDNQYRTLEQSSYLFIWGFFHSHVTLNYYVNKLPPCSTSQSETTPPESELRADVPLSNSEQNAESERSTFFYGAKSALRACNYLVLPTILGILGSIAYVIRGILDSFANSSLTFATNRRGSVRVYLGALLGLISGVIVEPAMKELDDLRISYSPLIWGFLMGYSVEFAFTLFDALIEKGRNALAVLKHPVPRPLSENPENFNKDSLPPKS